MAGSRPGVHVVQLKAIDVPKSLIEGNKFIKWDDDSGNGTTVTLKVDPSGYILYWKEPNKETDCLDISFIRDTRTGRFARNPKDGKLRDSITSSGTCDIPLEDRMITIVYGTDMCNVSYVNFAAATKEIAKEWTDALFIYATNLLAQNRSPLSFLEKCYTRLSAVVNSDGKIPVRNIIRMYAQHKDDKKKIEKALEAAKLPSGKNDQIDLSDFTFEDFMTFLNHHVCVRNEVEKIFHSIGAKKKPAFLTAEQFKDFLNSEQRDPRLNEILYPYTDTAKAQALIDHFEPNSTLSQKGHLSQDGFLRYLLSDENALIPSEKLDTSQDMDQPLSHYFINSSHNTYLTGHQLTGRSSVEIYRQALLTGCRCIELDCWDGRGADEEPIITHGFTMCTEIIFKEVIEAIAESAFKVSNFPVILSFENHCSPKQQVKMAQHCRTIFGDLLLTDPLESNPLEPGSSLPSPSLLKGKILVKNKKRHVHRSKKTKSKEDSSTVVQTSNKQTISSNPATNISTAKPNTVSTNNVDNDSTNISQNTSNALKDNLSATTLTSSSVASSNEDALKSQHHAVIISIPSKTTTDIAGVGMDSSGMGTSDGDIVIDDGMSDSDTDEEDVELLEALTEEDIEKKEVGTAGHEAEAGMEMSALVNYTQPLQFHSFEYAEKKNRCFECVSFVESQASSLLKEFPVEFVNYNKRQLSRIYPKGTRVDSSNYMPQIFWNAGCQLVALNFQTLDLAMQLNLGIFEYNGRSGYILKPDFMRRKDRQFDPFAESTVDGIVAGSVAIKVISGTFLTEKRIGTYVEVEMYGLPADTVRKKFKTKVVPTNGINPVYDEEPFKFRKVVLPTLATLRLVVSDENRQMLGHRVLPVEGLRPGYRHICLRNELNQPLPLATLFVHIKVGDFIPDAFADFAEALSNPIAYQSQLEKHAQQLAVLEEDFEVENEEEADEMVNSCKISKKRASSVMSRTSEGGVDGSIGKTLGGSGRDSIGTPTHLSRGGSLQNKAHTSLVKQDSTASGFSQGSQSSVAASRDDTSLKIASASEPSTSKKISPLLSKILQQQQQQKNMSIQPSIPSHSRNKKAGTRLSRRSQSWVSFTFDMRRFRRSRKRSKSQGYIDSVKAGPTVNRMSSAGSGNENGVNTGSTVLPPSAMSPLNGTKSSSLPTSPRHSVKYTQSSSTMGHSENGAGVKSPPVPSTPKIDVIANTQLMDPEVIGNVSVETLKQGKQYLKLSQKLEKEIDAMKKKHEKARSNLQELHELQEERAVMIHAKSKNQLEKNHQKSFKRASKHQTNSGNMDEINSKNTLEMNSLVQEHEQKHREMKKNQVVAASQMQRDQHQQEIDLRIKHHPVLYDTLTQQVDISVDAQMKRLDEIHDREVQELKKKLDAQNREEMKTLTKNHKDKSELDRLKREARSKHISLAVQERQKLQDMVEKRREEVRERHKILKVNVQTERTEVEQDLTNSLMSKCDEIKQEEKQLLEKLDCSIPQASSAAATGILQLAETGSSCPSSATSTPVKKKCQSNSLTSNGEKDLTSTASGD